MTTESQERNPYVGPRPFEQEDRYLFFGRDREVSEVLSLVVAHRVLLLYAQSGAGKTSLLNAGLIPLLEEEGFEVLPLARVRGLIPEDIESGEIPNLYVFNTLMNWAEDEADLRRLAQMSLADFLKEREHPTDEEGLPSARVVIFDQFEELFAFYPERWRDREGFFEQVSDALEVDPLLRVVFVMREDYIARLDPYAPLLPEKLRTRFRLERLRERTALSAVTGPLTKATPKRSFDEGVAEQLVENLLKVRVTTDAGETVEVTGEFVEPVQLQVVCQSLWQGLPPRVTEITQDHLQAFGDVNQALSGFYETCVERAARETGVEVGDLLSWFEHTLITPAGTRGTVYRGREETGGIPNAAVDVLENLHLIRGEWRAGARWYELTHDRFIGPIQESKLTWLQMIAAAKEITASLTETIASGFDSEVYLQRQDASDLFKEFMASEARCFVLTGKSGSGKSNFVSSLRDECKVELDLCLLTIDASQIDTYKGLSAFVSDEFRRHWGLRREELPDVWERIDGLPGMDHRAVLLVLDAVNENMQPRELLRQINEMLLQPWKWLKVLITSRLEGWQHMCFGQRLVEELFFQPPVGADAQPDERPYLSAYDMKPFNQDELRTIYARYRKKFGLETSYDDLSPEVRQLIQEPLQLWIVASTYEGEAVPAALPAGELVEGYINALIETNRLDSGDVDLLQSELVPLMAPEKGSYINVITVATLPRTEGKWLKRVFSEGYYSTGERVNEPFQRLVDAQIVVKRGQGKASEIQFQHERFYDHFLGTHLYNQIPKWYSDQIQGYQELFTSIQENPFIWGAVQRVLYLTLQNRQFERIKTLAVTDDPRIAHLIASVLVEFSAEDADAVQQIIHSLLVSDRRALSGTRQARLTGRETALRVALQTADEDALLLGLLSPEQDVSSLAVQYVYFLNQSHPALALDIFEGLIEPSRRFGLPNPSVIRSVLSLGSILLVEHTKKDEAYRERLFAIIPRFLRRVLYAGNRSILGRSVRTWFLKLVVQYVLRVLRLAGSTRAGADNLDEWGRLFAYDLSKRAPVFEMLPYLNPDHGTWDEIASLLPKFRPIRNQLAYHVQLLVIRTRGAVEPDEALSVIEQLYDLDYGDNWERMDAIYSWYLILESQQEVKNTWLVAQKRFVKRFLDESAYGYGVVKTDLDSYQYYPLMYYASTWNRVYPGREVDLIAQFVDQAEETHDQELLLHIIDGFGDNRFRLVDYRGPLRSLKHLVRRDDKRIQEHLANSLARLQGAYPEQISHFLLESGAPRSLRETVRQQSLNEPTQTRYRRAIILIRDVLLGLSPDTIQTIVEVLDEGFRQSSFDDAVEFAIKHLLNELGRGEIFFS